MSPQQPQTASASVSSPLNRTLFIADNYNLMRCLDNESVDLVCTDPPFAKNKTFAEDRLKPPLADEEIAREKELLDSWGATDTDSAAKLGLEWPSKMGRGVSFSDIWRWEDIHEAWIDDIEAERPAVAEVINVTAHSHSQSHAAYCAYMAVRLIEIHRILKPTGSMFLHCDQTANSYLRLLLDAIFGEAMQVNEITWCYKENETATRYFPRKHDTILWYAKSDDYKFNLERGEITEAQKKRYNKNKDGGKFREGIDSDRYATMKGKLRKLEGGAKLRSWWDDIPITQASERTGYPTQKPVALAKRLIKAATDENDIVFDPFAGCAYALVAAEGTNRQWLGCDHSPRALTVLRRQFAKFNYSPNGELLPSPKTGTVPLLSLTELTIKGPVGQDMPVRTDVDPTPPAPPKPVTRQYQARSSIHTRSEMLEFLLELSEWRAWCCGWYNPSSDGTPAKVTYNFELDHIHPKSKAGHTHQITNRAPLCPYHNSKKGGRSIALEDFRQEIAAAGELVVDDIAELVDLTKAAEATLAEFSRKDRETSDEYN